MGSHLILFPYFSHAFCVISKKLLPSPMLGSFCYLFSFKVSAPMCACLQPIFTYVVWHEPNFTFSQVCIQFSQCQSGRACPFQCAFIIFVKDNLITCRRVDSVGVQTSAFMLISEIWKCQVPNFAFFFFNSLCRLAWPRTHRDPFVSAF